MHPLCCMSSVQLETRSPSRVTSAETQRRMSVSLDSNASSLKAVKPGSARLQSAAALSPLVIKNQHQPSCSMTDLSLDSDDSRSPLGTSSRAKCPAPLDVNLKLNSGSGDFADNADGRTLPTSGTNVAGILYKWVNYGKGWRPRWFVLQEGVLAYYKVHGPDKVFVNHERQKGLRLLGDEAQRLLKKQKNGQVDDRRPRKAFGEVHLKVSSLRESKSDDKKFYIYSGTKTLHLRAETKEDRSAWMDALHAAKDLFPRSSAMSTVPPYEEIVISTEKLKARLVEHGLKEEVVKECEDIVLEEFSFVEEHLKALQTSRYALIERVRQLEAEKVELETTVVDEMQNQAYDTNSSLVPGRLGKFHGGSDTESDDDNGKQGVADPESDEDDDVFFDTRESLVSDSFRGSAASLRSLSADWSGEAVEFMDSPGVKRQEVGMELIGLDYPSVKRRTKLPDPKEKEKGVSLWSIIKDCIGKDLTKVCLPVYFNEPLSSLQRCCEDLEYSYLLDRAYEWGKRGNSLMRLLNVAAFAVSGYASTEVRSCKPFNPLLGETYEGSFQDKGLRFFSEKVSHHPMIVACHCEGRGWKFWGDSTLKSKFWGRSIQLDPVGTLTLEFHDGEVFKWSKVTTSIYNLILGKLYCDHYGTMRIQGNKGLSSKLKFKEQSIIDRNPHQVQGYVHDKNGEKIATLFGKWDEGMSYVMGDLATRPKHYDPMSEALLLWRKNPLPENPTRYGLTAFAITLNELTDGLKEKLPPTDSRLRPDQRHLENGEYEEANAEKQRLEQRQRWARKLQETGWQPQWFHKDKDTDTYVYKGGYWEARKAREWTNCPDIFGPNLPELPVE